MARFRDCGRLCRFHGRHRRHARAAFPAGNTDGARAARRAHLAIPTRDTHRAPAGDFRKNPTSRHDTARPVGFRHAAWDPLRRRSATFEGRSKERISGDNPARGAGRDRPGCGDVVGECGDLLAGTVGESLRLYSAAGTPGNLPDLWPRLCQLHNGAGGRLSPADSISAGSVRLGASRNRRRRRPYLSLGALCWRGPLSPWEGRWWSAAARSEDY